jgi:hypothetical protein
MWYKEGKEGIAKAVFDTLQMLGQRQQYREDLNERHHRLYSGLPISSFFSETSNLSNLFYDRLTLNVVQSCIDSMVSKIGKNKPRITFLTDEGDWNKQEQAKKLNKFIDGQFHKEKQPEKSKKILLDSCVFGSGFAKIYTKDKQVKTDRVFTPTIIVDDRETIYGEPLCLYELRYVNKSTLIEMYPDLKFEIEQSQVMRLPYYGDDAHDRELVPVVEAWKLHLKDEKNNKPNGVHFIGIASAVFTYEKHDRTRFPYSKLNFQQNVTGWFGRGIAELITGHQIEINRTLKRISDSLRLVASPKVLYEFNSKIIKTHFNNEVGTMIGYQGVPPQFVTPQAVNSDLFNHLVFMHQKAFEEVGLSQLSVTSQKPAGLNSGKALREYNDLETERFAAFAQSWEAFHVDLAELQIEEAKRLAKKGEKIIVSSISEDGIENIDFSKINLDADSYVMQPFPTSSLPKTPAGRLQFVEEMIQSGMLDPQEASQLLDFPDTKQITKFKYADREDIHATCAAITTKGEYNPPEEFQNLEYGIRYMQYSYLYYKHKGLPQARLDLITRWINDAMDLSQPPQPELVDPAMAQDLMPELGAAEMMGEGEEIQELAQEDMSLINQQGEI